MRKLVKTSGVFAAAMSLLMIAAAPANAQTTVTTTITLAASVFAGVATVTGGIAYPVCTDGTTPPNPPQTLGACSAFGQAWAFTADSAISEQAAIAVTCNVDNNVSVSPGTAATTGATCTLGGGSGGTGEGAASISAGGTLNNGALGANGGAWCGASGGTGAGTATVSGSTVGTGGVGTGTSNLTINSVEWKQSAATLIVAIGTASSATASGAIVTVVSAIPDPTVGTSCTNKTQTEFRVVGTAVAALAAVS